MYKQPVVLAFETTLPVMGVSLIKSDGEVANYTGEASTSSSVELLAATSTILMENDLQPKDLDLIAVSAGPGSFTGIRVGLATAKALAYGLNCEVIGVSILEAFALMGLNKYEGFTKIRSVVSGGRDHLYTQIFSKKQGNLDYSGAASSLKLINVADLNNSDSNSDLIIIAENKTATEIYNLHKNINLKVASDNVSYYIGLRSLEILNNESDDREESEKITAQYPPEPLYLRNFRIGG